MRPLPAVLLLSFLAGGLWADYPLIRSLTEQDPVFAQLQDDLEAAYRDEAAGPSDRAVPGESPLPLPPPSLYRYAPPADTDIFSLSAALNLPYDSLAVINQIDGATRVRKGTRLLVPSRPGIFLRSSPRTELDYLMSSWRRADDPAGLRLSIRTAGDRPEAFVFFPGERFTSSERAFFLDALYRYPLPKIRVSSEFGMRVSPISGKRLMHQGIDLAAPMGTPVAAAKEGKVVAAGWDSVLGNRVIVDHGGGWTSVYGHLSKILVSLNDAVKSGSILGAVGSTGESTGPHLHFEIRSDGRAQDPEKYLPRLRK